MLYTGVYDNIKLKTHLWAYDYADSDMRTPDYIYIGMVDIDGVDYILRCQPLMVQSTNLLIKIVNVSQYNMNQLRKSYTDTEFKLYDAAVNIIMSWLTKRLSIDIENVLVEDDLDGISWQILGLCII